MRYGGITTYQTDGSFSVLQVTKDGEGPWNLVVAPIKINGDKKLYVTFLPVGDTNVKGMKFAGIRRPSSKLPMEINGMKIVIEDAIGSTGLELKIWALQNGTTLVNGLTHLLYSSSEDIVKFRVTNGLSNGFGLIR